VAVEAMGKLVYSLTLVTEEPYTRYPGLFEGLVGIIQSDHASADLRLKAIQTAGLLGAVDVNVYNAQLRGYNARKNSTADGELDDVKGTGSGRGALSDVSGAEPGATRRRGQTHGPGHGRGPGQGNTLELADAAAMESEEDQSSEQEASAELERYLVASQEARLTTSEKCVVQ
jgi:hypothetical protein